IRTFSITAGSSRVEWKGIGLWGWIPRVSLLSTRTTPLAQACLGMICPLPLAILFVQKYSFTSIMRSPILASLLVPEFGALVLIIGRSLRSSCGLAHLYMYLCGTPMASLVLLLGFAPAYRLGHVLKELLLKPVKKPCSLRFILELFCEEPYPLELCSLLRLFDKFIENLR